MFEERPHGVGSAASDDLQLLRGRVALVTGASRGIGAGIAVVLARHGARVAVNYLTDRASAEGVVEQIEAAGGAAIAVAADATDDVQVAQLVAEVRQTFGRVDLLVCNAAGDTRGMAERIGHQIPVLDRAARIRTAVLDHLDAAFAACRHVVPDMRRNGRGTIVFIGSTVSLTTHPEAATAEIAVAKATQDALARTLAMDLGPVGVRVHVVAPGMVDAGHAAPGMQHAREDPRRAAVRAATPTGRVTDPGDVGNVVAVLASDLTEQVTGAVLAVDGGFTVA